MDDSITHKIPKPLLEIEAKSIEIGFTMPSDRYIGSLLKTLIASKRGASFLELGTGIGLSLSWMIDGMDAESRLTTIDNDPELAEIARSYFGKDSRVEIVCIDGSQWIRSYQGDGFDLVFADAWPGKYSDLEALLNLVKVGGYYIIDDMSPQQNWPEGHSDNVNNLIGYLEKRQDFNMTKLNWSTGLIIMTRKN